jgi:competence protein ComEC
MAPCLRFTFKTLIAWFWTQYPAFLYGIASLIGFQAAFDWKFPYIPFVVLIWAPLVAFRFLDRLTIFRLIASLLILLATFSYGKVYYQTPSLPPKGVDGVAHLSFSSLSASKTHFAPAWIYQGTLFFFKPDDPSFSEAKNVPYRLILSQTSPNRPIANSDYVVRGTLKKSPNGGFTFKVKKDAEWHKVEGSWSLAEFRFNKKQEMTSYLESQISHPSTASFLIGMVTGDYDDKILVTEFSRFGLQHILAISGFHFVILAAVLKFLIGFFFSRKITASILIVTLGGYFIFLGCTPAVVRAWITITIFFVGHLFERPSSGINALGAALLLSLLYDPMMCQHLGFQLSFLSTGAILFFYSSTDLALQWLLRKRPLSIASEMNLLNQHGYLLLSYTRQALALTLAVHIVALPVLLYDFNKFPTLSLIYNLFFPFLVSISMLLIIIAFLFAYIIPPLATMIHYINNGYTQWMLGLTYNLPISIDHYIYVSEIPLLVVTLYLALLFILGAYLKKRLKTRFLA